MQAAVCRAFGEPLVIEEVALDEPGAGEVAVDLAACAICHSDIIFADGGWGGALPAVYGHEAAGVVRAAGPGVTKVRPGDHVVVTLVRSCGHCGSCAQGAPVTCEAIFPRDAASPLRRPSGDRVAQGLRTGAFAEAVVVDASQVVVIPPAIPLDAASLLACGVITGFGAVVNTAGLRPGATAVVIGAGGVGLNAVQGAAIAGARRIIALDLVEVKLEAARRFGATDTVSAGDPDPVAAVRRLTGGRGADYVFVTVGATAAFTQALGMAARSGTIVVVGMPASGVTVAVDPGDIAHHNLRVLGSKMGGAHIEADIPRLVGLYQQGRLKLDELISERYPLARINDAIASARRGQALRNVIVFG
jgi:S-(hydroxymethyl)glutathione dehydrogenase / alcohol dehydrogenase